MIKINLLPENLKKSEGTSKAYSGRQFINIKKLTPKIIKIGTYCLVAFILFHFWLGAMIAVRSGILKDLDAKWQVIEPQKTRLDAVNSEILELEKSVTPIKKLINSRVLWAKRLNKLSDLTTTGVWLGKISIETYKKDPQKSESVKVLNIEGCVASLYGDEAALVGKFIKALQDDKEFFGDFSEIKLGPMEKDSLGGLSIMNFKVFCFFRKT